MRKHSYKYNFAFSFVITTLLMLTTPAISADRIAVFGDSLSDTGNIYALTGMLSTRPYNASNIPDAPYPIGGLNFSNGHIWINEVGQKLNNIVDVSAALGAPQVFNNYAFGGARARDGASPIPSLSQQVGMYLGNQGNISVTRQFIIIGGNDVRDAISAYLTGGPGAAGQIIVDAVTAISDNIQSLAATGALDFMIGNVPDLGRVPAVTALGSDASLLASTLTIQFNDALERTLVMLETELGIHITRLDLYSFINSVVTDPDAYGLVNVTEPCINPSVHAGAICDHPDSYLFWDGIHPTRAAHLLIANEALDVMH
jgi:phospholipase/lecithinase/hemolysin